MFLPASHAFLVERNLPHGHVQAVLGSLRRLRMDSLLASKPSRQRDLVLAMIAERLLHPCSKLATTRLWHTATLADELGVSDASEDDLYKALDWLLSRQSLIEKKLAQRHLTNGSVVLYDVSSSYCEGRTCPLARLGHNRGLLTETQIGALKQHPGLGWISALRGPAIRELVESGSLQLSLFDQTHLAEITSPDYPGERLVACFNPLLADQRRRKRAELIEATEKELAKLAAAVRRRTRTPLRQTEIALKAGKVLNRYKVAKHFALTIADGVFSWSRREESIRRESQLDGVYVVRTSEPESRYKSLAQVECAFRSLKGVDLRIRPIHHRTEDHVRAHVLLCMLAFHVEWHMRQDLATRFRNTCRIPGQPSGPTFQQLTEPTALEARAFQLLNL